MCLEEPQRKSKASRYPQLIPWVFAVVSILLLSACFIVSCLETHYFSGRFCWKTGSEMVRISDNHTRLTCIRGESEPGATGTWNCCPVSWRAFQSNCYFPVNDNQTWLQSERNCSGMGGHLASITTAAEQNFVTQLLDRRFSYFLGLTDKDMEGFWQWVDQTPFNPHMAFWHKGEPNDLLKEDCVVLVNAQDKWAWNDVPCQFKTSRICKLPGTSFNWKPTK